MTNITTMTKVRKIDNTLLTRNAMLTRTAYCTLLTRNARDCKVIITKPYCFAISKSDLAVVLYVLAIGLRFIRFLGVCQTYYISKTSSVNEVFSPIGAFLLHYAMKMSKPAPKKESLKRFLGRS